METCTTSDAMRRTVAGWRAEGRRVVLVPTMGALHGGHLALVAAARREAGADGRVVASIFVNPTQFGPGEDYDAYPRDAAGDAALLADAGVDALFLPAVADIHPEGATSFVEVPGLSRILIGRLRPGHFRGVTTVVAKLFHIVTPDAACFGEKDYQQLVIIRRMVRDLAFAVKIVAVPTQREADGLAMSSRNRRLSAADRAAAPVLARALDAAQAQIEAQAGQGTAAGTLRRIIRGVIAAEPRVDLQSIDIRDADDLSRVARIERAAVILLAARLGDVLLIDQRIVRP